MSSVSRLLGVHQAHAVIISTYFYYIFNLFFVARLGSPTYFSSLLHSFPFPFLFPSLLHPLHLPSPPFSFPQRTWPETSFITCLPLGIPRPSYLRDFILSLFSSSFTLRPFLYLSLCHVTFFHTYFISYGVFFPF